MGLVPSLFLDTRDTTPQPMRVSDCTGEVRRLLGAGEGGGGGSWAEGPAPVDTPRYRTLEHLGRGGSAVVWLVQDQLLSRNVAMKVLSPGRPLGPRAPGLDAAAQAEEAEQRRRFRFEARLTASLAGPGVVPVHDVGVLADGRCYYTMQHVPGLTLAEAIAGRQARSVGALGLRTLLGVLARICRSLATIHARGIAHRDLKPANLLIGTDAQAYVVDWGLAGPVETAPPMREGGQIPPGTLCYMAPELLAIAGGQVGGANTAGRQGCRRQGDAAAGPSTTAHRGPASDVYSLGVCLFEILTGQTPHCAESPLGLIFQAGHVDAPNPRALCPRGDIAPELSLLCAAALTRDPERRHLTAESLAERLEHWLSRP